MLCQGWVVTSPKYRTGRSNHQPVLSLSGFLASQRLELKKIGFPLSWGLHGARSGAGSCLWPRQLPRMPSLGSAPVGPICPHTPCSPTVHKSCLKRGKIKQHRGCPAAQQLGPQPKVSKKSLHISVHVGSAAEITLHGVHAKVEELDGAGEGYMSLRSEDPCSGQSPVLSAGHNPPITSDRCKHAGAAQQFKSRACRHPSPGCASPAACQSLGLACCLAEK